MIAQCVKMCFDIYRKSCVMMMRQRIALVQLPPFGDYNTEPRPSGITLSHHRLNEHRQWFVESPIGLVLDKGIVLAVQERQRFREFAEPKNW